MESGYIMLIKTNLNCLTLPLEFELRRYTPLASATHTNDLWLASSIKDLQTLPQFEWIAATIRKFSAAGDCG